MTAALTQATSSRPAGTTAVGAAALGAGAILLGFAGLQIALAAGAPLGEHVWGGTQERVLPASMRAIAGGPDLGRPVVDRIHSSRHQSMKELRAAKGGALRVLFSFDPRRRAILLLGGDKTGEWNDW